MEQKIKNWLGKILSQPSKIVLNKSVLSSMPIFSMGCFVLPKKITKRINDIHRGLLVGKKILILRVFILNFLISYVIQ